MMGEHVRAFAEVMCGLEQCAAEELLSLGCFDIIGKSGCIIFSVKSFENVCKVCYLVRSVNRVVVLVAEVPAYVSDDTWCAVLKKSKINFFVPAKCSFCVECIKTAGSGVSASGERKVVEGNLGGCVKEVTGAKVNLSHPEVRIVCCAVDASFLVGVDIGGTDLGKRDYRIFLGHDSLKAAIAFGLLQMASFSSKKVLLDPFCRAGTIGIEAALFGRGCSPRFFSKNELACVKLHFLKGLDFDMLLAKWDDEQKKFDGRIICCDESFQNVSAAKKNAKIAGVLDDVSFSRVDVEWLDLKLESKTVDCIVTYPPQPSRMVQEKKLEKLYKWFFHQAEFVLKKDGVMAIVASPRSESLFTKYAVSHKLVQKERRSVWQGAEELVMLVFVKC